MQQTSWDRRDVLWGLSVMAGVGVLGAGASPAAAQQVKYSSGTEPAKLKVPANACDCHHHIYGSQYKVDPRTTLRPGDATVDERVKRRGVLGAVGRRLDDDVAAGADALL